MTVADAIHLLHMHKHQVHGIGERPGLPRRGPRMEEMRDDVLRKVRVLERTRGWSAADKAKTEREWARRRE